MATRKPKTVPAAKQEVVPTRPIVKVLSVPDGEPVIYGFRDINGVILGDPGAPLLLRCPSGQWLLRSVDRSVGFRIINRLWRLTGGGFEHARIGPDCITYSAFCR